MELTDDAVLTSVYKFQTDAGPERAFMSALFPGGKLIPARRAGMAGEVVATVWGGTEGARAGPFLFSDSFANRTL